MPTDAHRDDAITIRPARHDDLRALVACVHELAEFERAADEVELDEARLEQALFCTAPEVFAHLAQVDGEIAGMVIWFFNYSTWTGRPGLYVEDLYVRPDQRRRGIGRALLAELAALAAARDCARLEWSVLDWNTPAVEFYESIGARARDGWTVYRLTGPALAAFAASR